MKIDEEDFEKLYYRLSARHQIAMSIDRASSLWKIASSVGDTEGDIVELGVYKGGSALLLCEAQSSKKVHLYDTFSGLPPVTAEDQHKKGDFADTNIEQVEALLNGKNAEIHQGVFSKDTKDIPGRISLAHIDADLYESTRNGLEAFWPNVVDGGLIVCDDYGWPHCPGVKKAVDEFCTEYEIEVECPIEYQCVIRKSVT